MTGDLEKNNTRVGVFLCHFPFWGHTFCERNSCLWLKMIGQGLGEYKVTLRTTTKLAFNKVNYWHLPAHFSKSVFSRTSGIYVNCVLLE